MSDSSSHPRPKLATDDRDEASFFWTLIGYMALLAGGVLTMLMPGAMRRGNELPFDRAVFHVVNAVTLSGFPTATPLSDMQSLGQTTIFLLVLGGVVLVLSSGALAVNRITGLGHSSGRIFLSTIGLVVLVMIIGAAALATAAPQGVADRTTGLMPALFASIAALGNCGLSMNKPPAIHSWQLQAVLLPISLVGSLGVVIVIECIDLILLRGRFSRWTWTALASCAGAFVLSTLLLMFLLKGRPDRTIISAGTLAMVARTFGLGVFAIGALPRSLLWVLMLIMMIGGVSGGSSGGIKFNTIVTLVRGVRELSHRRPPPRSFVVAGCWLGGYLLSMFVLTSVLLALCPELSADRAPFLVVSALSCVGLSHDPVSLSAGGMYTLCAAMLIGRLAPLAVLWWLASGAGEQADDPVG